MTLCIIDARQFAQKVKMGVGATAGCLEAELGGDVRRAEFAPQAWDNADSCLQLLLHISGTLKDSAMAGDDEWSGERDWEGLKG